MRCWYCEVREAGVKQSYRLDMYGKVNAKNTPRETDVAYNVRHIEIARCEDCKKRHHVAFLAQIAMAVLGVLFLVGVLALLMEWFTPLLTGLWVGITAALCIGAITNTHFVQLGIRSLRDGRHNYPEVKDLLEQDYKFGKKPKEPLGDQGSEEDKD